jgi:hypothetical protein
MVRDPSSIAPRCDAALTILQKRILSISMNGDPQTGLLMHIIRFVMPSKSKPLKKLMYLFLEVCPKHDSQGKLRQEWILVWCVHTQSQLGSSNSNFWEATPNEYVRGNTLRFLYATRPMRLGFSNIRADASCGMLSWSSRFYVSLRRVQLVHTYRLYTDE